MSHSFSDIVKNVARKVATTALFPFNMKSRLNENGLYQLSLGIIRKQMK